MSISDEVLSETSHTD